MVKGPALDNLAAAIAEACRSGLDPDALRERVLPRLQHRADSVTKADALFAKVRDRTSALATQLPSNYELLKSIHRR